jgi:NAD(P)-dependent dehydrogenase (short-subunit alcohol dehydrogenase family)
MAWNYSGARVIVTGGAGFIGSHLCEALIHLGSEVVSVDNYLTGRAANLDALAGHPSFSSLTHDITSPFVSDGDAIFNLACPASPVWYQRDPIQTMRVNILGSLNVLDLARHNSRPTIRVSLTSRSPKRRCLGRRLSGWTRGCAKPSPIFERSSIPDAGGGSIWGSNWNPTPSLTRSALVLTVSGTPGTTLKMFAEPRSTCRYSSFTTQLGTTITATPAPTVQPARVTVPAAGVGASQAWTLPKARPPVT